MRIFSKHTRDDDFEVHNDFGCFLKESGPQEALTVSQHTKRILLDLGEHMASTKVLYSSKLR